MADLRCEAITSSGQQCRRKQDGVGTRLCVQHHYLKFGKPQRHDANGCVAGRAGYLGHHGHLHR